MVSYILKIKNVQEEEFTYTYEDSKAFFYKRANIGFANERYPQNFELVEPIYEREDSAQVKSMYNHILELFTSYDEPLTFTIIFREEFLESDPVETVIFDETAYYISYTIKYRNEIRNSLVEMYPSNLYASLLFSNEQHS